MQSVPYQRVQFQLELGGEDPGDEEPESLRSFSRDRFGLSGEEERRKMEIGVAATVGGEDGGLG